ncbi:MAG: WYL domain-containing protein [Lachnospiraceae bacterium]|nr:WYL domain-containing protein [Lachnospiraceae bacterium]
MAKSSNQKMKILYLLKILFHESDAEHAISMKKILEKLEAYGISAERKSIYDDFEKLYVFGIEVKREKGGYYIDNREFEIAELKMLTDAVLASKFITERQTKNLIKKLETLASVHEAKLLDRQVYMMNANKGFNKAVYYNVDYIYEAINSNKQIEFKYFDIDINRKQIYRNNDKPYVVSPYALIWDDENYYLVAYNEKNEMIRHYRVDKMDAVNLKRKERIGKEEFDKLDMSSYTKSVFGMFGGKSEMASIVFPNRLIGVVYDRFGRDVTVIKQDEEHFMLRTKLVFSEQFYGWLFGLGSGIKIVSPPSASDKYKEMARNLIENH